MKTPVKILIVAALAATVVAAIALKPSKPVSQAKDAAPAPTVAVASADTSPGSAVATAKLPRLLDLGAGKCIPCKMMAPILEELRKDYAGRLEVLFIDVWQDPDAGKSYGIEAIPTQIFFDAEGKELFRHVGFYSREDILGKWKELGVELK
jgi:thioredoxin 1